MSTAPSSEDRISLQADLSAPPHPSCRLRILAMAAREILSPEETAGLLGYSREVLLRECRRGRIPFRRLNARKIVFIRGELLRWVDGLPGRSFSEVVK